MSNSSKIKALRRAKDLTQDELAEILGVSSKAVSQWECENIATIILSRTECSEYDSLRNDAEFTAIIEHLAEYPDKTIIKRKSCGNRLIKGGTHSFIQSLLYSEFF